MIGHAIASQQSTNETATPATSAKDDASVAFLFGLITCVAGILGVSMGTFISQAWKSGKCFLSPNSRADPIICSVGSFLAFPFLLLGFHLIIGHLTFAWISIFIAILFLCLNWAINMDMLLYIIEPNKRSFANSLLILLSHMFGDASGPYVVGYISDLLRGSESTRRAQFDSLVRAFYLPCLLLIVSGIAFALCAWTLTSDIINTNYTNRNDNTSQPNQINTNNEAVTRLGVENDGFAP